MDMDSLQDIQQELQAELQEELRLPFDTWTWLKTLCLSTSVMTVMEFHSEVDF